MNNKRLCERGINRQTHRHTDIQTDGKIDRQADTQTNGYAMDGERKTGGVSEEKEWRGKECESNNKSGMVGVQHSSRSNLLITSEIFVFIVGSARKHLIGFSW